MIQEIIPLTRPRTLAAALGPTILGASFSYYAFGAVKGTGLAIFHTMLIFLAVVTAQIVANLWNEYKDFKSGLDAGQKVGNAGSITRGAITPELIVTMIKRYSWLYLLSSVFIYRQPLLGTIFQLVFFAFSSVFSTLVGQNRFLAHHLGKSHPVSLWVLPSSSLQAMHGRETYL